MVGAGLYEVSHSFATALDTRERIVARIRSEPGISLGELRVNVDVGWGTIYHHLHALEREGHIVLARYGRRQLAYPCTNRVTARGLAADSILRGRTAARLARAIVERPSISTSELAVALQISERAAYRHVQRLVQADLLQPRQESSEGDLVPSPFLVRALRDSGAEGSPPHPIEP